MSDDEKRTLRSDDLVGIPLAVLVDDLAWYLGYTRAFIEGSPRGERVHAALRAATDAAIEGGAVAAVGRPRGSRGGLMASDEEDPLASLSLVQLARNVRDLENREDIDKRTLDGTRESLRRARQRLAQRALTDHPPAALATLAVTEGQEDQHGD